MLLALHISRIHAKGRRKTSYIGTALPTFEDHLNVRRGALTAGGTLSSVKINL